MDLPNITAVEDEAARSLADLAKDARRNKRRQATDHAMTIEVRDDAGPVLKVQFAFEVERGRQN